MPLGLVALLLKYLILAGLLVFVAWVLRVMMSALPAPELDQRGPDKGGRSSRGPRSPRPVPRARRRGRARDARAAGSDAADADRQAGREAPARDADAAVARPADMPWPRDREKAAEDASSEGRRGPAPSPAASQGAGIWPDTPSRAAPPVAQAGIPLDVASAADEDTAGTEGFEPAPAAREAPPAPARDASPEQAQVASVGLLVADPGATSLRRGQVLRVDDGLHIGRALDSDLVLDASPVSRQHAYLGPRGDAWVIVDEGSINGTYVNGERLAGPREVLDGDEVEMGGVRLVFRRPGGARAD